MTISTYPKQLRDRFGRTVDYVRLSITDRCDFRCVYCMAEDMVFLPRTDILSLEEIYTIAQAFVALGVTKIRITGGEPLVRKGALTLLKQIGNITGLRDLVLTTNGSQLATSAVDLKTAGVKRINISLDSLNAAKFKQLTRTGDLKQVLNGIDAARSLGFERLKINAVILKHINDTEICDLVQFAIDKNIDISFIEEMPLGIVAQHNRAASYYSSADIKNDLAQRFTLIATDITTGGPANYFHIVGTTTQVGFISPHSNNFCATCNRVRVTVEGRLLLCLGNEHSVDLKTVLRQQPNNIALLKNTLITAMQLKPEQHEFNLQEQPVILRYMNMTGG